MKKLNFIFVLFLLGCTSNDGMRSVQYDYLLNDGNSKVWMIDQMIIEGTDISARLDHQKELLIFFNNGDFQYIPIRELGHKTGRIGQYTLDSDTRTLKMDFKRDTWYFNLTEITEDSIYLTPMADSKVEFSMQLIPLKLLH